MAWLSEWFYVGAFEATCHDKRLAIVFDISSKATVYYHCDILAETNLPRMVEAAHTGQH